MWNIYLPPMLDLRSLVVVVVLPPLFLLNSQVNHINSCPIFILQTTRQQQQHLLFTFHCFRSLCTSSISFSNVVYPLSVSRFDVTKILMERKPVFSLSRITFPILSILTESASRDDSSPFLHKFTYI